MANMRDKPESTRRIAMLIDGDNAQPSLTEKMLAETSKYGMTTIRRIYGDWTASNMGGWKDKLQTNAIQPIQQFRYTIGKNATDSAMIIDAMDILYGSGVDGFCLVSSDSDYTRLATRIREKGFFVMGIGKKSTPRAFVNACDVFVYTQNLVPQEEQQAPKRAPRRSSRSQTPPPAAPEPTPERGATPEPESTSEPGPTLDPIPLLKSAFEIASGEDGWAFLGTLGHHLRQLDPGFDARTYGFKQLSLLIAAHPETFEVKEVKSSDGTSVIYVRLKEG